MIFEPLKGYEGLYSISRGGVIISEEKMKGRTYDNHVPRGILKQRLKRHGRYYVALLKNGVRNHFSVHRLVAIQFIPNPDNKPQVNHKDGNPKNNHVDNLEWCTAAENIRHAFDAGLMKGVKGKDRWQSKPVKQMDLLGTVIKIWESISMACKDGGFSKGNIIKCCKGRYETAYGFKWSYA